MKKIGQIIKEHRLRREMTLKDFSKKLGISEGFLSYIENDKRFPSRTVLKLFARSVRLSYPKLYKKLIIEKTLKGELND